jgi:octaprenyl-diphosphate synthase
MKKSDNFHPFCVNLQLITFTITLVEILEELRKPVEANLERFNVMLQESLHSSNKILNLALEHLVKRRGKQMRPILLMLAARGANNSPEVLDDKILHAAIAMELLHTASLVHDDIVDESDRRRGHKSINSLLDNKAAVLVGDFLLSKSIEHAVASGNFRVVELISNVGIMLSDGELLQLSNVESDIIDESSYYEVIRKKTASLFSACAEIGALLSTDNEGYIFTMKRFGMLLGICFQLRDDIFDYDPSHDVGKPSGNDMKEGKLTLPVIFASQKNELVRDLAMKVRRFEASAEEIEHLVQLARHEGGVVYAEAAMTDFSHMASGLLEDVPNKGVAKSMLNYLYYSSKRDM